MKLNFTLPQNHKILLFHQKLSPFLTNPSLFALQIKPDSLQITLYTFKIALFRLKIAPLALKIALHRLQIKPFTAKITPFAARMSSNPLQMTPLTLQMSCVFSCVSLFCSKMFAVKHKRKVTRLRFATIHITLPPAKDRFVLRWRRWSKTGGGYRLFKSFSPGEGFRMRWLFLIFH